jgi:hypothetical protein
MADPVTNGTSKPVSITFKVNGGEDVALTAMLLTRTLENAGLVGQGAYASVEGKLLEEGYITRADDAMKAAVNSAKEQGVMTIAEMHSNAGELTVDNAKPKQRSSLTIT